jgi:hypothetical protein
MMRFHEKRLGALENRLGTSERAARLVGIIEASREQQRAAGWGSPYQFTEIPDHLSSDPRIQRIVAGRRRVMGEGQ